MESALDASTLRSVLSWTDGVSIPVTPVQSLAVPATPVDVDDLPAHVFARPHELTIQLDVPNATPASVSVARDETDVLHVWVHRGSNGRSFYRRFDFAGAYDLSRARAWSRYGVITVRAPHFASTLPGLDRAMPPSVAPAAV